MNLADDVSRVAMIIKKAKRVTAFTGAGISVESGIRPFRGEGGLWNIYDSSLLELDNFKRHPKESWELIIELFYNHFGKAKPNAAHLGLAELERLHFLQTIITQNIDNLHQDAGSKNVYDFHGNTKRLICLSCDNLFGREDVALETLPPRCKICGGLIKPDITFFGEAIPEPANRLSFREAQLSDVFIIIGSTGEVLPAALIPEMAKDHGAQIIEINVEKSLYTPRITDIFLQGSAAQTITQLMKEFQPH